MTQTIQTTLTGLGLARSAELYAELTAGGDALKAAAPKAVEILCDICARLERYHSLTPKQAALVAKLTDQIYAAPAARERERLERAQAADCPAGRLTVEGECVSFRWRDTPWGTSLKTVIKTDQGYRIWGSADGLTALDEWQAYRELERARGMRVRVTASLTPSEDDPKFGFFKRPAKWAILREAA